MSRKGIGISLLAAGSLLSAGGIAAIGYGVTELVDSFHTIVTFEAPGSRMFAVSEAGPVTLWHDFQTLDQGRTVREDPDLPAGFRFELLNPAGAPIPLESVPNATMSVGSTSRQAVGSFQVPKAGGYEILVEGPEKRIFSVTEGTSMEGFMPFMGGLMTGLLGGFAGLAVLIAGAVVLLTGRRKSPAPPTLTATNG
jgi:hypothetical protein